MSNNIKNDEQDEVIFATAQTAIAAQLAERHYRPNMTGSEKKHVREAEEKKVQMELNKISLNDPNINKQELIKAFASKTGADLNKLIPEIREWLDVTSAS